MPPKRSRSKTPTPASASKKSPSAGRSPSSGRASAGRPSASSKTVTDNDVQRLIEEAMAKARAARGGATAMPTPPKFSGKLGESATDDGMSDSAPEKGSQLGNGFFSSSDRIYSRKTTQCLTDLAGFLLLAFLAFYFSAAGYAFYQELSRSLVKIAASQ